MVVRHVASPPIAVLFLLALAGTGLAGCTASADPAASAGPAASTVDERLTGDAGLLQDIAATYSDDFERTAVAVVDGDDVRTAFVDADESTVFELGSITKVLTGELLAIAVERGEVSLDDKLGDHLDLGDAPAASVTLLQLATHSSGLPREPDGPGWMAKYDAHYAAHEDPIDEELGDMLALARTARVTPDAGFGYSNFGAALLGQALASAAGIEYPKLLWERVLDPIGMDRAVIVETPDQVPDAHAGGFSQFGDAVEPYSLGPYSPAGGVDATLDDVVALARAVLDGDLRDSAALKPVAEVARDSMIGYFWFIDEVRPRTITGHGGQTGGFGTALMINRETGIASIVLTNTESDPYPVALRLLITAER